MERARFTVDEVVTLTIAFYKRNYIEGLFLSSGIIRTPDFTMEQLMLVAKKLRRDHGFAGYIHLKSIPEASPWLIEQAGLFADRMSINLELPTESSLARLAPEKDGTTIRAAMGQMQERITEAKAERRRFSPAGQSTQMIVGADDTTDAGVLATTSKLYGSYGLKRVYYSAFSPHQEASSLRLQKLAISPNANCYPESRAIIVEISSSISAGAKSNGETNLALSPLAGRFWPREHC